MHNPIEQFRAAIQAAGLTPPEVVEADGKLRRFASNGKPGDDAGWYALHDDGIPAGSYGCWRTGLSQTWRADIGRALTPAEEAAHRARAELMRREREAEEATRRAEARERASLIWAEAGPCAEHPYLARKGIEAHGARLYKDALVIPLRAGGELHSLQFIAPDGGKRFLTGGRVAGCYYSIGTTKGAAALCIAEGFATGATIHEATGYPVTVAFNAGNLEPVARALRERFPGLPLIVCGDDDYRTEGNPGLTKATEAARSVGGMLVVPDFGTDRPEGATDFNDMQQLCGLEAVKRATSAPVRAKPQPDEGNPTAGESGPVILDAVQAFLGRFVAYPSEHAHVAHALWIAHTYLMEAWDSTPRIAFLSPEPGSGKSRALEVSELLVPRPVEAVNVTPAYLFRKVGSEDGRPTILYDEIDTVFGPKAKDNEEIRGLLNAGHRKHSVAGRCVVRGKQVFTEEIPAYCAVALAGLGGLPDTILTRSVVVRMRRRAPSETVEPYRRREHGPAGAQLARRLATWAASVESEVTGAWPVMPKGIHDRDADVWESLLAVADAAGGRWPEAARVAAVALVAEAKQSTPSLGIQLLADLRNVFSEAEALSTETILTKLHAIEESPWGDLRGKPLDARGLSNRLRPYGVSPVSVRIGGSTPKGYYREALWDVWTRYLGPHHYGCATSATSATSGPGVAHVADVADAMGGTQTDRETDSVEVEL